MSIPTVGPRFGLITRIIANRDTTVMAELDRLDESPKARLSTINAEANGRPYAITATGPHIVQVLNELKLDPKAFDLKSNTLQRAVIDHLAALWCRNRDPRTDAIWALREALGNVWRDSSDSKTTDLTNGQTYVPPVRTIPEPDVAVYEETGSGVLRD